MNFGVQLLPSTRPIHRIHYVITDGGGAPNASPKRRGLLYIRHQASCPLALPARRAVREGRERWSETNLR